MYNVIVAEDALTAAVGPHAYWPGRATRTLDDPWREDALEEVCSLTAAVEGPHRHLPAFAPATRALAYRTAERDFVSRRALVGRPQSAGKCGTALGDCTI